MFFKESKEIYHIISQFQNINSTVLNIGSSTKHFREVVQPYIEKEIFTKLKKIGFKIIHSDIKNMEGVDLIGNILDIKFQNEIKILNPSVIICSNLLEHIENRKDFLLALDKIIPKNSYLIVTVPYKFPYHPDPIDTMYRPSLSQLKLEVTNNNLKFIEGEVLNNGLLVNLNTFNKFNILLNWVKLIIKFFMPFYKFTSWKNMFLENSIHTKVTIAVFKKVNLDNALPL